jgi:hypothetical protein
LLNLTEGDLKDRAGYGYVTDSQREAIARHVKGREVTDLGCQHLMHSKLLLTLGAKHVIAVDKEEIPPCDDRRITRVQSLFRDYREPVSTLFLSWPINHFDAGMLRCVMDAERVILISKNTDGIACGFPGLYRHLLFRKLLAYVPDPKNCLTIVGEETSKKREPTGEERAALGSIDKMWSYVEAEMNRPQPGLNGP